MDIILHKKKCILKISILLFAIKSVNVSKADSQNIYIDKDVKEIDNIDNFKENQSVFQFFSYSHSGELLTSLIVFSNYSFQNRINYNSLR